MSGPLTPTEAARIFPRGVGDPWCPRGGRIQTSTDHRLLWHIENVLAVSATNDTLRELQSDLRRYLNTRCDHHWDRYEGDAGIPEHWQCLWCSDVLWSPEVPAAAYQTCTPADDIEHWPVADADGPETGGASCP